MAKIKFRSSIAELSEKKSSDSYVDSRTTHHFFHRCSSLISYTTIDESPAQAACAITKITGQGLVNLPIGDRIVVEASHALKFSTNIISVGLRSDYCEIVFSKPFRGYHACFLIAIESNKILTEVLAKEGL